MLPPSVVLHPQPGIASPDSTNSTTDFLLPRLHSPVANISSWIASLYTTHLLDNLSYCVLAPAKAAWNGTEAAPNPPIVDLNVLLASWMPL